MKKIKPFLPLLISALVIFSGCGNSANQETKQPDKEQTIADNGVTQEKEEQSNFNPTGFPIVNEKVEKNFMIRKPAHIGAPEEMETLMLYEEMTNVKIIWDTVSADGFAERVNLVMASNNMPDAIIKGVPDVTKTSADGSIIDLTALINNYSTGIKSLYEDYPAAREASFSPDGKIYAIPCINTLSPNLTGHRNLWINKVWLDNLGLDAPETLDEFVATLTAFRDMDANGNGDAADEIPYVVEYSGDRTPRSDVFMGSFGIVPNMGYYANGTQFIHIVGDAVEFIPTSDSYREVLKFMNLLWGEKLLDNAIYTQTSDVALSKFNSDISGCFGLSSDDLWSECSSDYIPLAPVKVDGIEPVIPLGSNHAGGAMVITKADQSPEITLRWIDYFYTDEGSRLIGGLSEMLDGITCQQLPDGTYEYSDDILNSSKGVSMAVGSMCPLPGGGFPYWRNENNSNFIYSQKVRESVPAYESYYQKTPSYAYPVFSIEDSERVNDIRRDLDVYVGECQAKFITGELSFDKWDEYVETCKKMYSEEITDYFQTAYDRMK